MAIDNVELMNDTNTTESRQPVQSSGIATGFDLKTCREKPGGDGTAIAFGMVARFHRLTSRILRGYCQTCTSPVSNRRHTGHQTQTMRSSAGRRASCPDSDQTRSTSVRRAHMELAPTVGGAFGWIEALPSARVRFADTFDRWTLATFVPAAI